MNRNNSMQIKLGGEQLDDATADVVVGVVEDLLECFKDVVIETLQEAEDGSKNIWEGGERDAVK